MGPIVRRSMRKTIAGLSGCAMLSLAFVTGCAPSTVIPIGNSSVTTTASSSHMGRVSWKPVQEAVHLGLQSPRYQEKVTVSISEGSIQGGFTAYGRVNPPDKVSVQFHQTGSNTAFYQQGLSAYGEQSGHWQQYPALPELNLFPAYSRLVQDVQGANVSLYQLSPKQYVVDEYCNVYQAIVPGRLVGTLPEFADTYHAGNMSAIVYTFYVGQTSGELREVTTNSEGAVRDIGGGGIQTDTILFAINQSGSAIAMDPNLYDALLYQY